MYSKLLVDGREMAKEESNGIIKTLAYKKCEDIQTREKC